MTDASDLERFDPKGTYDDGAADYELASARFWRHLSDRTVARLDLAPGARVLDIASGPGWSALSAAARVGPSGRVVALDSSPQMLDRARANAERAGLANLDYQVGDMTRLPFDEGSFDAVISVLGIFFVPDMPALVRHLWRQVRPGGQLAITVPGSAIFEPAFSVWARAVAALRPDVLLKFPWQRTGDPDVLRGVIADAGIDGCEIVFEPQRVPLDGPEAWWQCVMGSGLRRAAIELGADAERIRTTVAADLVAAGVDHIEAPGIYARATRPAPP